MELDRLGALASGDVLAVFGKSSSSSDTSVSGDVKWFNISPLDAETDVDSTGTETITIAKALEALIADSFGNATYDPATGAWVAKGRDGSTTIVELTLSSQIARTGSTIS